MKFLILVISMLPLFACAPVVTERYVLPLPPNEPKVEWLGTYHGESDLNVNRLKNTLLGTRVGDDVMFRGPSGIVADGRGLVYVGDVFLKNIVVVDLVNKTMRLIDDKLTIQPRQLTLDSLGNLYVADTESNKILKLSPTGQLLKTYGDGNVLNHPMGVALDEASQRIYVADSLEDHIVVFGFDGQKLFQFGETGIDEGKLYRPASLTFDASGQLYVAEQFNARISIFNKDGKFVRYFGQRDDSPAGMESIRGIQLDSEGNLWMVDFRRAALRAYTPDGALLMNIIGPAEHLMGFSTPSGISITADDDIYIADYLGRRIAHWRYLSKKVLEKEPLTKEQIELLPKEVDAPPGK